MGCVTSPEFVQFGVLVFLYFQLVSWTFLNLPPDYVHVLAALRGLSEAVYKYIDMQLCQFMFLFKYQKFSLVVLYCKVHSYSKSYFRELSFELPNVISQTSIYADWVYQTLHSSAYHTISHFPYYEYMLLYGLKRTVS